MERFKDGLNRREFIKTAGMAVFAATRQSVYAQSSEEDLDAIVTQEYLALLEPIKNKLRPIIEANDLFVGFKRLHSEQRMADFEMYFPMYWGAQETHQAPWPLLWIMHVHETTVSREVNPDLGWQKGAMQRDIRFYDTTAVKEAVKGWGSLRWLPQRYKEGMLWETNDYEEIFFAAWKLKNDARKIQSNNPSLNFDEAILQAQYHYCAREFASQRISKYREIAPLLTIK